MEDHALTRREQCVAQYLGITCHCITVLLPHHTMRRGLIIAIGSSAHLHAVVHLVYMFWTSYHLNHHLWCVTQSSERTHVIPCR